MDDDWETRWNYRVIDHRDKLKNWLGIHEVYYHRDRTVCAWTERSVGVVGNTLEELRVAYILMAEAFVAPVLVESEGKIVKDPKKDDSDPADSQGPKKSPDPDQ